ncbi:DNA gyrase subunit A [candidate division TA06 bacterium DG_78]|uniref:DNA gyrase subunit A n=1 Tax=candidate division TA06 bacterium DG_78 TaxID=1703772 RepID=A0A0S7YAZ6_UNCT6|nr:MAG: DNA gyrase subunit A [candidate division TA06 bacterium DG_78]
MKERITTIYIEDEIKSSYLDYAMSVIVGRALPDARDGLKPVQRRILYAMSESGLSHNRPHKKSATVIGDVLGKYHPHGDMAIYDALVRMAQTFSMRYVLVDGQGNFGSVDGDAPAAYRYTEARLTSLADEILKDLKKDTVDFIPNFDGRLKEPIVLPSSYPNLLCNGASGIAVGMATNIPPHNLSELINALTAIINNDKIKDEELIQLVPGPDFPTGGIIIGTSGIKQAYKTGKGRIVIRGKVRVEDIKGGKKAIVITEIPYQVNKSLLLEKIARLAREKKIEDISDLRDESDKDGIRVVIELKRDANSDVVLNNLYKYTTLQTPYSIQLLALVFETPKTLSLREALQSFLDFRFEVITRRTKFELSEAEKRAHILEGLKIAIENIDEVVQIIKRSKDTDVAKKKLMKRFSLSEIQAQAILDMRLARLTNLEKETLEQEYLDLIKEIARLKSILKSPQGVYQLIKEELEKLDAQYKEPRRTIIVDAEPEELTIEDLIGEEDMVVTLTQRGYIKRQAISTYRNQMRGGHGRKIIQIGDEDFANQLFISKTTDTLLFFSDSGKVYARKVYQIPEAGPFSKGRSIANLIEMTEGEKITACLSIKEFSQKYFIFMATKMGKVKKTNLADFANIRRKGIIAVNLGKGDRLIAVQCTSGNDSVLLTTKEGLTIRFSEKLIRPMGRNASGVRGVRLAKDNEVIGFNIAREDEDMLIVAQRGIGKRVKFASIGEKGRAGKGMKAMKIDAKTGKVAGITSVNDEDDLIVMTKAGKVIRTPVHTIKVLSRQAKGVKVISLAKDDEVCSIARIKAQV